MNPVPDVPPQDLQAEQSVIAAMMLDEQGLAAGLALVTADDLFAEAHQVMYRTMGEMHQQGIPVDTVTLCDALEKRGQLDVVGGAAYVIEMLSVLPHSANISHYAGIVNEKAIRREFSQAASDASAEARNPTVELVESLDRMRDKECRIASKLTGRMIQTAGQMVESFNGLREPIIVGLLRLGEIMNVIAAPKVGKSWLVLLLALVVATGRSWLGKFPTRQGRVLIVDNELHPETLTSRLRWVADQTGIPLAEFKDSLCLMPVRGEGIDISRLITLLSGSKFDLIILDAWYKFAEAGADENSNSDVTAAYSKLDQFAKRTGAAIVCIHHASKGNQSNRAVTDIGAGAGSQSRAADTHLVLRPHDEPGALVIDAVVRSFPPITPFCVRQDNQVWIAADDLDPSQLKQERGRKSGQSDDDRQERTRTERETKILTALAKYPDGATITSIRGSMSSSVCQPILDDFTERSLVGVSKELRQGVWRDIYRITKAGLETIGQTGHTGQSDVLSRCPEPEKYRTGQAHPFRGACPMSGAPGRGSDDVDDSTFDAFPGGAA